MGAISCSDICNLIQNLIERLFSKNDYLLECIKMVITLLVINIFPWNLRHCTQHRERTIYPCWNNYHKKLWKIPFVRAGHILEYFYDMNTLQCTSREQSCTQSGEHYINMPMCPIENFLSKRSLEQKLSTVVDYRLQSCLVVWSGTVKFLYCVFVVRLHIWHFVWLSFHVQNFRR